MTYSADPERCNLLLRALSAEDFDVLAPHLERVTFARDRVLVSPNRPIEHMYFPEDGVASIVSVSETTRTEVGIFGRDGVSGVAVLLGADQSPHETFVQIDGQSALRIDALRFQEIVARSDAMRALLLRYVQTMIVQSAQTSVSNAHQRIEARLARWILMCHDRVDGDELAITHQFLAMMIAAERSGVTVSLHILKGFGAIRSKRGRVIVRDRALLEELAGDTYGVAEAEYRRLIGPLGRGQHDPA